MATSAAESHRLREPGISFLPAGCILLEDLLCDVSLAAATLIASAASSRCL
jgi:hypothetical protein